MRVTHTGSFAGRASTTPVLRATETMNSGSSASVCPGGGEGATRILAASPATGAMSPSDTQSPATVTRCSCALAGATSAAPSAARAMTGRTAKEIRAGIMVQLKSR
ncbi:MAG: hypothetical protein R3C52_07130 [Hyphomonadaceae bacterium]